MAWRNRKHPLLCKLKTCCKAPDPGVVLSKGNTRLALWIWKRNFTRGIVRSFFGARPFTPTSLGLFLVHSYAAALLPRSSVLPLKKPHTNQPLPRGPEHLGVRERDSLVQGGHFSCLLPVIVAITICSASLGWAGLLRLTGRRAEPWFAEHSQRALAASWQLGKFLPRSSYFIYVTVCGKHLARHLTDTSPATESWEKSKQPPGIIKCSFMHLKPHSLLSATRAEPGVIQLKSVKDRLKIAWTLVKMFLPDETIPEPGHPGSPTCTITDFVCDPGQVFFLSLTSVSLPKWGKGETALVTYVNICRCSLEELNVTTAILPPLTIVHNFWWSSNSQR